jgi:hypothetical protein
LLYGRIDFLTLAIAAATLHVTEYKVMADRIEHRLRYLCSCAVVEKDEVVPTIQGRESPSY